MILAKRKRFISYDASLDCLLMIINIISSIRNLLYRWTQVCGGNCLSSNWTSLTSFKKIYTYRNIFIWFFLVLSSNNLTLNLMCRLYWFSLCRWYIMSISILQIFRMIFFIKSFYSWMVCNWCQSFTLDISMRISLCWGRRSSSVW